jgi:type II secretory pathway pseudopilin PulG
MRTKVPFRLGRKSERGYILLTLMLAVTLLAIAAAAIAPSLAFQVRRDREEELIHRGVQYSRAIRKYYKKFGRYPTRLEDLENTNNLRFLRRRYKDPITTKDFKLLHFGEVQMTMGGGIAGATLASAMAARGAPGAGPTTSQGFSLGTGPAQNGQTQLGQANSTSVSAVSQVPGGDGEQTPVSGGQSAGPGGQSGNQVFGGGPIVGVVSTNKDETIREFNNKNHYNQWQFIYDPGTDRGGLLNTPAQPALQVAVQNTQPGANGGVGGPAPTGAPGGASATGMGLGPGMGSFGSQPPPTQNQPTPQPSQPQQ